MEESPQAVRLELDFTGTGLQLLGWGLLATILSILVIPAAWGSVPLYAWFFRNVRPSDGTAIEFSGRPGEIWVLFAVIMFLGYLPQLGNLAGEGREDMAALFLTLLLMPLTTAVGLVVLRWLVGHIRLQNGPELTFAGSYGGYLGWTVVVFLSWFTIIGWPFALTAFTRWMCGNIEAEDLIVSFEGKGLELLWRGFLALVMSLPMVTVPWVLAWLLSWFVRNTYLYRRV